MPAPNTIRTDILRLLNVYGNRFVGETAIMENSMDCISESIKNIRHTFTHYHAIICTQKTHTFQIKIKRNNSIIAQRYWFVFLLHFIWFGFLICCLRSLNLHTHKHLGDLNWLLSFWVWMNQQSAISSFSCLK